MKKVKIMLLSLALFAVVGGALAFKAKFDQTWCLAPTYGGPQNFTCTTLFQAAIHTQTCNSNKVTELDNDVPGAVFSCTSIPDLEKDCATTCPNYARVGDNG